ncbi:MAG: ribonuclease Z [Proteobacteria bacterium]|nr:ribonuclease Z [Pseudomonadota bacterium]MBU1450733.1 ribonuclease Z [Pseudomonadota bacterium]MBU2468672.1 ribonuclease Z [Pseudomonadota bacterium]MBU2519266.1 ribonuclease Z [Pseudomonadota bacterium]
MRITVLGSGTCELRAQRSSPAYLVEAGGVRVMLDLGQGAWRRLLDSGRRVAEVDGVVISHPHPDHMADLIPWLFALKYDPVLAAQAQSTLLAHAGLEPLLAALDQAWSGWLNPPLEVLTRRWLEPGDEAALGEVRIGTAAAVHHAHSLAWRLEAGGRSLVYLGDSEAGGELAALARGADLLICHCAGTDQEPKAGHLHPAACGELAAAAGVGALLLSHFYRVVGPEEAVASAAACFSGPVWAAFDGLQLELTAGGVVRPAGICED